MRQAVLVALLLTSFPMAAGAQSSARTIPAVSADIALGLSMHPENIGETWYRSTSVPASRITGTVRLGSRGRFRPVLTVDRSGMPGRGDFTSDCPFAPNNTCRQYFPTSSGLGIGLGVRALVGGHLTAGVGAGTVLYGKRGTFFEAELAVQPGRKVGWVLNLRHVELHQAGAARMWFRPITVGIRLQ